jgi:hypothetical protein
MTMEKQKYTNVKKVYYNVSTGHRSALRESPEQICFDSTAEFRLYQVLTELLPEPYFTVSVHQAVIVAGQRWKLDFLVNAKAGGCTVLAEIVNRIHGTSHDSLDCIHVEYKGLQDDNFKKKMEYTLTSSPRFAKTIILVGGEMGAFGFWDEKRECAVCHPILSSWVLESLIIKSKKGMVRYEQ